MQIDTGARHFDDLSEGQEFWTGGITLTEGMITDFAFLYDPQPFHIDRLAAEASVFKGLAASGFQTLCLSFRLIVQTGLLLGTNLAGTGMDEIRWHKPVRPGDTIRVRSTVKELKPSRSKSDRGSVTWFFETFNQADELVFSAYCTSIVLKRAIK
ncbi:MaoC family dehydratase [Lacibacterium aquatile]|uniref:MaoC family dehydratase n=1 Tax=Lacibacterium aquatile TaxID=1168082 RepID=A0ABW5DNL2_9PROT